jgi:DNA polymerase-1
MLAFDYRQLELREAAALSGDPKMRQIFVEGHDPHRRTAELIWKIGPDKVTPQQRDIAKTVNFGVLYGMSAASLSYRIGVTIPVAEKIMRELFGEFVDLKKWIDQTLRMAKRTGTTSTLWHGKPARRRALWRIADIDDEVRARAEHGAWNTPVQGSAADKCLWSLTQSVDLIEREKVPAVLCMSIHDSLIFEAREDVIEDFAPKVRDIMCSIPNNGVPLEVEAKVGPAWGSMEDLQIAA